MDVRARAATLLSHCPLNCLEKQQRAEIMNNLENSLLTFALFSASI
jgi:hypothetical protein